MKKKSVTNAPIDIFSANCAMPDARPLSSLCGMIRGTLRAVEPGDYDTISATFNVPCHHCGSMLIRSVPLPVECRDELAPLVGRRVGIMRYEERYIIREFPALVQA